jgi:S-adenosyl methyltransferase
VRYLAGEAGISQFLDVGTGLPTVDNAHEMAQQMNPAARIVYVDNDPLVLAHARALLTSTPEGRTDYLDADVRDPDAILAEAKRTLDFGRPVALMLLGIMQFVKARRRRTRSFGGSSRRCPPGVTSRCRIRPTPCAASGWTRWSSSGTRGAARRT